MTCRHVRKALAGSAPVELPPALLAEIKQHAESCSGCAANLAKSQRLDAAMALLVADPEGMAGAEVLLASSRPRSESSSSSSRRTSPGFRWLMFAGGTSLTLVLGIALGGFAGIALLVPTVDAKSSAEFLDVPFLNEAFVRGGGFFDDFESGLGAWKPQPNGPNYAELSGEEAHSGSKSLKFYHREYGGLYDKRFNTPVPAGGIIRLATWVLSPRGGAADNKWLNLGIGTGTEADSGPVAGIDVLSVDSRWQPVTLQLAVAQTTPGFHVQLTTGPGHGQYSGWDWASWVDDVRVYLNAGVEKSVWMIEGDTLRMAVRLPKPYGPKSADLTRVYVRDLQKRISAVPADERRVFDDVMVFTFRSPKLVAFIQEETESDGSPVSLQMVLSAQIGDIPCIFSAGIRKG
ncbi:MAG: hypothetical protein HZC36_03440 [Armatimonadetes bacterium]|nr:hypothetical protein [Armatimonadota bacterium]